MNKLKSYAASKRGRDTLLCFGIVIIAYIIVQAAIAGGGISSQIKGLLVPICAYVVMAVSLNLTVGISGELSLGHAGFMSVGAFSGIVMAMWLSKGMGVANETLCLLLAILTGGAAAGIGSMLVDLLGGYASFVPGTLVIKFLDAMAAALVVKALGKGYVSYIVGGVVGEAIMVAGYFAYEGLILGMGMGAAAGIPSNLVQAVTGIVIALVLVALLKGSKALDKIAVQW